MRSNGRTVAGCAPSLQPRCLCSPDLRQHWEGASTDKAPVLCWAPWQDFILASVSLSNPSTFTGRQHIKRGACPRSLSQEAVRWESNPALHHQSPCRFRGPEMGGEYGVGGYGRAGVIAMHREIQGPWVRLCTRLRGDKGNGEEKMLAKRNSCSSWEVKNRHKPESSKLETACYNNLS